MAIPRKFVRDWRGRFAKVASTKSSGKTPRKKIAKEAYAKRSEQMAQLKATSSVERANRAQNISRMREREKAAIDRAESKLTAKAEVEKSSSPSPFTMPRNMDEQRALRGTLTHVDAMQHINDMPEDIKAEWRSKSIKDATSIARARMIFRVKHGNRIRLNGFGDNLDLELVKQALHAADKMATKYPEVRWDELNSKETQHFASPENPLGLGVIAHAGRRPNPPIASERVGNHASISMMELNEVHLKGMEARVTNDQRNHEQGFSVTDVTPEREWGAPGLTVLHEFGHLVDYHAYEGQHAEKHTWLNGVDPDKMAEVKVRVEEIMKEFDELLNRTGQPGTGDEMQRLMKELKELEKGRMIYPEGNYPKLTQGRNGSVRKAIGRAYNRSVGRPEHAAISKKSLGEEGMLDFVAWTTTQVSNYSILPSKTTGKGRNEQTINAPIRFQAVADRRNPGQMLHQNKRIGHTVDGELWWNYPEIVAESFADVEANGRMAHPISKEIHAQLIWQLDQDNGGIKAALQGTMKGKPGRRK